MVLPDEQADRDAFLSSPEELAKRVDVLVVAAAGGSGTQKLVDRDVIDALGPDGYPVNIARESVVDEPNVPDACCRIRLDRTVNRAVLAITSITLGPCRKRRTPNAAI